MSKVCIILAGGFGTRLQSVVNDLPKSMANIADKPFLHHLFNYIEKEGFSHVILSLGYKSETVISWLADQKRPFEISYVIENTPLGTGGAIRYAFESIEAQNTFVFNGDTFFDVDTNSQLVFHKTENADITIALKEMEDFDRYGSVQIAEHNRITKFNEKQYCKKGLINGGVYIINKDIFSRLNLPERFSFEKDIIESYIDDLVIYGYEQKGYFIDIGIPSDYEKANIDFKTRE